MIFTYEYSAVGSAHLSKGETTNQDAKKIESAANGWVIAAIADGVGSCKYSDIASAIAVDISVQICLEEIKKSDNNCDLLKVIETAFSRAEREIDNHSLSKNHLITDYDTTLSLVIYDGKHITYGHSGDGGIIGLTNTGDYVKITDPQKKEGVYVIPLREGKDSWIIDRAEGEFASVLLATDGVYDTFFPYLLKGQPIELYVPLIRYFMDNNILKFSEDVKDAVSKEREDYLNSDACASITDDKTLVVLVNGDIQPTIKDDVFYAEPDWKALQLEWDKKAYPHLYKSDDVIKPDDVVKVTDCKGADNTAESAYTEPATVTDKNTSTTAPISTSDTPEKEETTAKRKWPWSKG